MTIARFGSLDGADVHEITLRAAFGMEVRILTWGAVLRDLKIPGPGGPQRVVLGLNTIEDYVAHSPYFGAVVGRYANRIGDSCFTLDGQTHRLVPNWNGRHQLHGGPVGFGQRLWTLIAHDDASATLALVSRDGDMGYPGRLVATATYALAEPATLQMTFEATCDAPTPVNLTTHAYFNLAGAPDILGHELAIAGDFITPTDADLIPTGEVRPVAGTAYDFRAPRPIGAAAGTPDRTLYDMNYVLRHGDGLSQAATLSAGGLAMELWTTEPGLQFYDGHLIDMPVPGLGGVRYGRHAGLCLEPQRFPDGPNHAHFPPCILRPGAVSRQASEFRFRAA